ncbi:malonic semialdehyde reductase [Streptomyces sp. NPDC059477]|uniref:malonic semialdehyde reductase n=1 Tax=Streptomyces sp. NPDC059477 TaxID=3346847 RepID=UPI0036B0CD8A
MPDTPTPEDAEITLSRLDENGRATLFTHARTVNNFSERPVSQQQLKEIYELMKWGPTWANTLPLRILYLTTPESKDRLLPHLDAGNTTKAKSAPVNAVLAVDNTYHHHIPRLLPFRPQLRDALDNDPELHGRIATGSGWLQAAYFLFAVRAVGLAAGPLGGFDAAGIDAEFFPEADWNSFLVVNIGHPGTAPWFDRLPRLNYDEAVRHI